MAFLTMLRRTVSMIDLPFGYTLTIWTSGAIATDRFGLPTLTRAFAFLLGGVAAYLLCVAVSFTQPAQTTRLRVTDIALINVFSIIAAVAVSIVSFLFANPLIGYCVAAFVGTMTYILLMSTLVYLALDVLGRSDMGGPL